MTRYSRTQTFHSEAVVHFSYSYMVGSGYEINDKGMRGVY